jgi:HNH endonuclease
MPATDCDLDHREAWVDGGPTTEENLAPLCRHDHIVRHNGWTIKRLPDGSHQWTSRLGHTYITDREPP